MQVSTVEDVGPESDRSLVKRRALYAVSTTVVTLVMVLDENGLFPAPSAETVNGEWLEWEFDPPVGDELIVYTTRASNRRSNRVAVAPWPCSRTTFAFWITVLSSAPWRWRRVGRVVDGVPLVIIQNGQPIERTPAAKVRVGVLEPSGRISFIQDADATAAPEG